MRRRSLWDGESEKKGEELHTDDEDGTRAGSEQLKQVGGWEDSFFRI